MTGVRGTTDRATKWMRYIARALTAIWAVWWIFLAVAGVFCAAYFEYAEEAAPTTPSEVITRPGGLPLFVGLVLAGWVCAAIPWRWERAGGVLLLVAGLLLFGPAALCAWGGSHLMVYGREPVGVSTLGRVLVLISVVPVAFPLVAGILFLRSSRKSRRSAIAQSSADEGG